MSRLAAAALLLLASLMPTDSPDGDEARVARVNTATGVTVKDAHDAERTPRRGVPARATRAAQRLPLLEVTCYLPTGRRTASGAWPRVGMAASNRWPFGTRVRVAGRSVVVLDRIGHGSDLDLFFTSRTRCLRFGRQLLAVEVMP